MEFQGKKIEIQGTEKVVWRYGGKKYLGKSEMHLFIL